MSARSLILLLAALLIAGTAAYIARSVLIAQRPVEQPVIAQQAPPPTSSGILVAAANLPAGTLLKPEHLKWQPWPDNAMTPGYIVQAQAKIGDFIGAVVRRGIAAGEPIQTTAIVKPGERGFLAAVLKPGMRAIAIGISETSGIAGLVLPGDRVDLLLTHAIATTNTENNDTRRASETVLENVRVLAIDQTLDDIKGQPVSGKVATLEVTPKQAEMVAVAVELGRLQLSLRSLAKEEQTALDPVASSGPGSGAAATVGAAEGQAAAQVLVGGPGADPAAANTAAATPDSPAPTLDEDSEVPLRGQTYTLDSEVSRLLRVPGQSGQKVQLVQGSKTQQLVFEQ